MAWLGLDTWTLFLDTNQYYANKFKGNYATIFSCSTNTEISFTYTQFDRLLRNHAILFASDHAYWRGSIYESIEIVSFSTCVTFAESIIVFKECRCYLSAYRYNHFPTAPYQLIYSLPPHHVILALIGKTALPYCSIPSNTLTPTTPSYSRPMLSPSPTYTSNSLTVT